MGRDGGLALGRKRSARRERFGVFAQGKILDFVEQGLERSRLIRQFMVIPGRRRVGRQRQNIGQIDTRIELGCVRTVVEIQDLRQQDDAVQIQRLLALQDVREHR